eukprot:GEMP01050767.1.p1 GENE.GEMP01050767.1~~GEMP01050767.1.p1  ORF type:complete len:171 (+),score=38.77 GEMP01050767.1:121-633(+)
MAYSLRRLASASVAGGLPLMYASYARCEDKKGSSPLDSFVPKMEMPAWLCAENAKPFSGGVTMGGATGAVAGFTCKKIGKAVGIFVGGIYIMFQTAAHYEYITINWKKVEKELTSIADTNKDGKIDEKDLGQWYMKALEILSTDDSKGLAAKNGAAGSFAVGFLYGFRKG